MVAHLLNVDKGLAETVAKTLGLEMPKPAEAARPTRTDLTPSSPLSILRNPPKSFGGRKVGALITDGVDADLVNALRRALDAEQAQLEFVASAVGGIEDSHGNRIEAEQSINGGPSVLYDAVALLISEEAAPQLMTDSAARDFVSDAFAHSKFIAYTNSAAPLIATVLGESNLDEGFIQLQRTDDAARFVNACRKLRLWQRKSQLTDNGKRQNGTRGRA